MEEKLKRECKSYLEKLFKKEDELGSSAVTKQSMIKILKEMIPEIDFNQQEQEAELNELTGKLARQTKYTVLNKATNQFDVQYQENSIDFPSALYICVYFLMKLEKKNSDCFSGRSTVSFADLNKGKNPLETKDSETKPRRLF